VPGRLGEFLDQAPEPTGGYSYAGLVADKSGNVYETTLGTHLSGGSKGVVFAVQK
jgi:hypothetical protein